MTRSDDEAARLIALGNALEDSGRLSEAREHYRRASAAAPGSPRPWLNLGNVLARMGSPGDALGAVDHAIALAPDFAPSHYNRGRLLAAGGDAAGAEAALRGAIGLDPAFTDAKICLADLLEAAGRGDDAQSVLEEATAADPGHVGALHNLELLLMHRQRIDALEAAIRTALAHPGARTAAFAAMGRLCTATGRLREADEWYARALEADPASTEASAARLFNMLARDDLDPQFLFDAHREVAATIEARTPAAHLPARAQHARVRVGYLSPDFRMHSVALFVEPVLSAHDRSAFEVFCYYSNASEDAITERLKADAEHWRNIAGMGDERAADLIRADEIDVLVDLAGHTGQSRLPLLARRCAPVQVSWLGYLHSTGLSTVDYRICDAHTDPPGETEHLHTERLVRMPASQWCYRPLHQSAPAAARPNREERVVFGSFNQFFKVSGTSLALWQEILHAVPGATLRIIGVPPGRTTDALSQRFAHAGIAPERIEVRPRVSVPDYFNGLADVDVALDTTPYNGATTTLDALWMGVPVVALRGDRSVARSGVSILATLGVPELVAATPLEYVRLNVELARDAARREALRAGLRQRLLASPLMDAAAFTRDLESHYTRLDRGAAG
ncbi:MAG TPA: tetratricopeptide repeat protein [Casimicrobiaceae bacterium]|nr:tetratricopeptide repeat protein [Casimicrobiaceae bacterium]